MEFLKKLWVAISHSLIFEVWITFKKITQLGIEDLFILILFAIIGAILLWLAFFILKIFIPIIGAILGLYFGIKFLLEYNEKVKKE